MSKHKDPQPSTTGGAGIWLRLSDKLAALYFPYYFNEESPSWIELRDVLVYVEDVAIRLYEQGAERRAFQTSIATSERIVGGLRA